MDQLNWDLFTHDFTNKMEFRDGYEKIKCFRVIDENGKVVTPGYAEMIPDDKIMKIYNQMVQMNEADSVYNAAQRQARISFYMTQLGEEASVFGSVAALKDQDLLFTQYRETGAFLWRGFSIQ